MIFFKNFIIFLILLCINSTISINYTGTYPSYIKIRPVFDTIVTDSWLNSSYIDNFKKLKLNNETEKVYFEFQDIRNGDIKRTKDYLLWKYSEIYKDYINEINANLDVINNTYDKNDKM